MLERILHRVKIRFTQLYPIEHFTCVLRADRDFVYTWDICRTMVFALNVQFQTKPRLPMLTGCWAKGSANGAPSLALLRP
eukprot:scaffold15016_cov19-Prasinocladus_malaysianus.AAC.4